MDAIRDYKNPTQTYNRAIERLRTDERLPKVNRELAYKWVLKKQKELEDRYNSKEEMLANRHKTDKTLTKYCSPLLTNVCFWFKDFTKLTEADLKKFKEDFKNDRIKSVNGKIIKDKIDYLNKVIKSDFFKHYLGHRDIVEKVYYETKLVTKKEFVEFIVLEDLNKLIKLCSYDYQKIILYLLFSTGMRIGCLLNMKKRDFEIKYNPKTKINYYLVHIKKEYLKGTGNNDVTVPVTLAEANEELQLYLEKLNNDDYVVPMAYTGVRSLLENLTTKAKIKTKPDGKKPTIHILRKSAALWFLNSGYSLDQVKSFLAHKPSSKAIDCYINYAGLSFEPEVSKVQTDELMRLQQTIKDNNLQMSQLQQQMDFMKENEKRIIEELEKKMKDISALASHTNKMQERFGKILEKANSQK